MRKRQTERRSGTDSLCFNESVCRTDGAELNFWNNQTGSNWNWLNTGSILITLPLIQGITTLLKHQQIYLSQGTKYTEGLPFPRSSWQQNLHELWGNPAGTSVSNKNPNVLLELSVQFLDVVLLIQDGRYLAIPVPMETEIKQSSASYLRALREPVS